MKPPILVISDDVDLFESARDAERYLEAPEVREGITVLDADGRPIRALIVKKFLADVVRLEGDPEAAPDVPALRAGLIRLISGREGVPNEDLTQLSLEELLRRGLVHVTR